MGERLPPRKANPAAVARARSTASQSSGLAAKARSPPRTMACSRTPTIDLSAARKTRQVLPGSTRVSRVGAGVSHEPSELLSARRREQHAIRVRSPIRVNFAVPWFLRCPRDCLECLFCAYAWSKIDLVRVLSGAYTLAQHECPLAPGCDERRTQFARISGPRPLGPSSELCLPTGDYEVPWFSNRHPSR